MEQSRNGGGKVVTFDEAMVGRHRNGSLPMYRDIGRVSRPLQPQGTVSRRRTYADGELDVFSAERYFKGAMEGVQRKEGGVAITVPPAPLEMVAAASAGPAAAVAEPVGTRASVASSATSANSQTMLLRGDRRRRDHRDKKCCVQIGALMRSCSGKRSVRVDSGLAKEVPGTTGEPVASKIDWYRELRMQKAALGLAGGDGGNHGVVAATLPPPNLNLGTAKVAAVGRDVIREDKAAEFASSSSSRRRSFTLVAPVRANVLPANGRVVGDAGSGGNEDDDGAGSESSSDLFEIKSLMIDDSPYEPSEASIQWSVATASAADAPERGDRVSARWIIGGGHRGRDGERGQVAGKQNRDRPAALLSGCVSHRAVEVSSAMKALPNAPRRRCEGLQKARDGA